MHLNTLSFTLILKQYFQITKLLLDSDANPSDVDALGATPLHRAASQGRVDIVEILLKCPSIKLDLCDSTGCTAL